MNTTKKYTPPVSKTIYIDSAAICDITTSSPVRVNPNEETDESDGLAKGYNGSWDDEDDNWEW